MVLRPSLPKIVAACSWPLGRRLAPRPPPARPISTTYGSGAPSPQHHLGFGSLPGTHRHLGLGALPVAQPVRCRAWWRKRRNTQRWTTQEEKLPEEEDKKPPEKEEKNPGEEEKKEPQVRSISQVSASMSSSPPARWSGAERISSSIKSSMEQFNVSKLNHPQYKDERNAVLRGLRAL